MVPPSTPSDTGGDAEVRSRRDAALGHLQPFALDICANWREVNEESSTSLHEGALEDLHILQAEGRIVLLSAPRAGHGKTHLLGRVAHRLTGQAVIATVPWHSADDVSWAGCGAGVLHDLATGAAHGTATLQTVCGGVLATLLRRLIQTGRIPSTDPAQALRVLADDPMELFKEGGNARVIGDWFRRHFDQLRKPLADISNVDGSGAVEDWLRGFLDYVDEPSSARLSELHGRMEGNMAVEAPRFVRLLTIWKPLVLVADHMDGLYRDPAAGVAVARMTLALSSLAGVHVVLSVNQDLWETTFGRQLPSALEDRLNARSITLRGLTAKEAEDLIAIRLKDAAVSAEETASFLRFVDVERFFLGRPIGSVSARALLRHASQMWRHWLMSEEPTVPEPEYSALPAEGFLMEQGSTLPPPLPAAPKFPEAENMEKLAANLAADAGGRVVSLSGPVGSPAPAMHGPAPSLISPVAPPGSGSSGNAGGSAPFTHFAPASPLMAPIAGPSLSQVIAAAESPAVTSRDPGPAEVPETTFQKLRQMLAKLKVANDEPAEGETPLPRAEAPPAPHHGANGGGAPTAVDLQAMFQKYREEIGTTDRPSFVELPAINELVRLAGRRFPVVNYDEVELPGLLGRSLPRWSLQSMEIIFGLEDFSDSRYWKTVSSFLAGRLAELNALDMDSGHAGTTRGEAGDLQGGCGSAGPRGLVERGDHPGCVARHRGRGPS